MHELLFPTLFGLEACCRDEIVAAGYALSDIRVLDGRVSLTLPDFPSMVSAVARLNIRLRTAERVLLLISRYSAPDFDSLYEGCSQIAWEDFIVPEASIKVKGHCRNSQLFSVRDCQAVLKKAIVKRLCQVRQITSNILPEDESKGIYQLQFSLVDDQLSLLLDTSGTSLHKRGYRPESVTAPLRETLAAALLMLSFFERQQSNGENLLDLFCGSGTIPIEAALIQQGIAPGLKRKFAAEKLELFGRNVFKTERELAQTLLRPQSANCRIFAQDIDAGALKIAQANAKRAGVDQFISFRRRDIQQANLAELREFAQSERLLLCLNPPYGERLGSVSEAQAILQKLGELCFKKGKIQPGLRLTLLSPANDSERLLGARADKKRKLFHGALHCNAYLYFKNSKTAPSAERPLASLPANS